MKWPQSIAMRLRIEFARIRAISPQLDRGPTTRTAATFVNMPPLKVSHLLACIHQTQHRKLLIRDRVEMVMNDRELFYFIQGQLRKLHSQFRTALHK